MGTRDLLLLTYGAGWLIVLVITAIRGPVPAELWGVLAVGLGGIMAAFKTTDVIGRHRPPGRDTRPRELGDGGSAGDEPDE